MRKNDPPIPDPLAQNVQTPVAGLCPACLLRQGATQHTPGTPFEPPPLAELARLFPQLEIIRLLGQGGMGAVYQARQPALERFVALKILPAGNRADAAFPERFNREARALARLNHPSIVAIHESGQADGLLYLIMEYVDGANLRQLQRAGQLSPREALQIVPQICDALQFAHDEGVVHRDIKPENVLVDRKGRVKIADFGLAKILGRASDPHLTAEGQVMGTPHYMAPEQIEHPLAVDHRADIFSLGVVFYEMLTGELPLGKFAPPSQKAAVDTRVDGVVLHALEKEPARRFQHASEVKTEVVSIANSQTTAAVESPAATPAASQRRLLQRLALPAAFALAGIGLWWGLSLAKPTRPVLPAGVVALWRAEGDGRDSKGTNNAVLQGNVTYGTGRVGQAFSFDGINSAMIVPASPSLAGLSFTVECWICPTDLSIPRPILEYGAPGQESPVHLWMNNHGISYVPGALFANIRGAAGDLQVSSDGPVLPANRWSHVALTYDNAKHLATLYCNGAVVATASSSAAQNPQTLVPVNIGYRRSDTGDVWAGRCFAGKMDEIGIFNRALSGAEVETIYAVARDRKTP